MAKLKTGMSEQEVVQTLGEPYEIEVLVLEDGQSIKVLKYLAELTFVGPVLNSDLTPVCFQDDKVIGWGRNFYHQKKQEKKLLYP